jgi:hypothetical protein
MTAGKIEYTPHHFRASELVDPTTYAMHGDSSLYIFDPRILQAADKIREFFDAPVTCNNWMSGGEYQFRGYRPPECLVGAKNSEHKHGRALDLSIKGVSAKMARLAIVQHSDIFLPFIKRMESGVSWLHIDCSPNCNQRKITLFGVPK